MSLDHNPPPDANAQSVALESNGISTEADASISDYLRSQSEGDVSPGALDTHLKALATNPDHPSLLLRAANVATHLKEYRLAADLYEKIAKQAPDDFDVQLEFGTLLVHAGRSPEALDVLLHACCLNDTDATLHLVIGNAYSETGRFAEAVASYETAMRVAPQNPNVRRYMAIAYSEMGKIGEAREMIQAAAEVSPRDAYVELEHANIEQRAGNSEVAWLHYQQAAEWAPDDLDVLRSVGQQAIRLGEIESAKALLRRVVEGQGRRSGAWYDLGLALQKSGQQVDAVEAFRIAVENEPTNTNAFILLRRSQLRLHQWLEAFRTTRRGLQAILEKHKA